MTPTEFNPMGSGIWKTGKEYDTAEDLSYMPGLVLSFTRTPDGWVGMGLPFGEVKQYVMRIIPANCEDLDKRSRYSRSDLAPVIHLSPFKVGEYEWMKTRAGDEIVLMGKQISFSLDEWSVRDPYAWVRVSEWEIEPGVKGPTYWRIDNPLSRDAAH